MRSLLSILLLPWCMVSAQDYIPMLQEGNTWSVDVQYVDPIPPNDCCLTITHQISIGETELVNGLTYYRLQVDGTDTCLVREDNGLLFKYDSFNEVERILYDFNLEVGNPLDLTISGYNNGDYCLPTSGERAGIIEVIETSTQFLAGANRKVIIFNEDLDINLPITWIEGIGNISGMDFLAGIIDGSSEGTLVCFTTQGTSYFFNNATSCDNTTLGFTHIDKDEIKLYPNPVISKSILQFPVESAIDAIRVFDNTGHLIIDTSISKNYYLVDMMQYASGLYFYQVFSHGVLLKTEKFVVH